MSIGWGFRIAHRRIKSLIDAYRIPTQSEPDIIAAYVKSANSVLGIVPGVASAFVLLTFLLTVIISFPFSPVLKRAVSDSQFGIALLANAQGIEKKLHGVFGDAILDTLNFLTIDPSSEQTVQLTFTTEKISVDYKAEQDMLKMVNQEREKQGLHPLVFDEDLAEVARAYSKDMFARGYFSHYTPEGLSPFDRMAKMDIKYQYAGENLALAPNTVLAMQGLMQSQGHRANILSPQFKRVGIGVIDGGIYGEMFAQEFKD